MGSKGPLPPTLPSNPALPHLQSDDLLEPFPDFDFNHQAPNKAPSLPPRSEEVFYDAPSLPPKDQVFDAPPPSKHQISDTPLRPPSKYTPSNTPPPPVPAKAHPSKLPPPPPKRRRSAEFSNPTAEDQSLIRAPPLPPKHAADPTTAAITIPPATLAPGVPQPVYSFLWSSPRPSSAGGSVGLHPVLEFARTSDAIAFELASSPFTVWGGSGRGEGWGLSNRQVRVRMPRDLHSVHRSPVVGYSVRWCFGGPEGADELNEWVCCVGSKSMWRVEGCPVLYCVDI